MKRRDFIAGAVGASTSAAAPAFATPAIAQNRYEWRMVTTWPKNFPGLGVSAARIAQRITDMSDGRLTVKVYSAGELVKALESLDAVIRGAAEMCHSASYYWHGKSKALGFFTGVPFGMTATEQSGWMRYLGGQEIWDEVYAQFGLKGFLSGQTGTQAGGWFKKELRSTEDIKGLRFRTPGLGGQVWERLGATVVNVAAHEIFHGLHSGSLDAAEFVSPYNDLALGFHQVAKNYYFPSFIEPSLATECVVNKAQFDSLPKDLRTIVEIACQADYDQVVADFCANDPKALYTLVEKHGVQVRMFPDDIIRRAAEISAQMMAEMRESPDPLTRKTANSYATALNLIRKRTSIQDQAFLQAREAFMGKP